MPDLPFAYQAQTPAGQLFTGILHVADLNTARDLLVAMNLRNITLTAHTAPLSPQPPQPHPDHPLLQHFTYLTARLPLAQALPLIAHAFPSHRLTSALQRIAADLDRGLSPAQAFARYPAALPPLYRQLIHVNSKPHHLPAVLLGISRHLERITKMRLTLYHAAAYPLVTFAGMLTIIFFMLLFLIPPFREIFNDFRTSLPALTEFILNLSDDAPNLLWGVALSLGILLLAWFIVRITGKQNYVRDYLIFPIPILGDALHAHHLARWCEALRLALLAEPNLPAAMASASDVTPSPRLRKAMHQLIATLNAGGTLEHFPGSTLIPLSLTTSLHLAQQQHNLPATLAHLADTYEQESFHHMKKLPFEVSFIFVFLTLFFVAMSVVAMFLPLVHCGSVSVSGGE